MAATKHAQAIKNDTKEFITAAVMQILSKEKLSALTVSGVCKRAGVSRMAFYRNFETLEQVLYQYYQPKIGEVFRAVRSTSQDAKKLDIQLEFFDSFGEVLLLAADHGFEHIVQQVFIEEIEKFYAAADDEYWITFMSFGVYSVWRKWLLDRRQKPLKEIMGLLRNADFLRFLQILPNNPANCR